MKRQLKGDKKPFNCLFLFVQKSSFCILYEKILQFVRKATEMLESISARDMFLLLRMTDNSPSLEEILNVFSLLSTDEIDVLEMNKQASAKENTTYTMKNAKATVNRLKMIANAIEKGIEK